MVYRLFLIAKCINFLGNHSKCQTSSGFHNGMRINILSDHLIPNHTNTGLNKTFSRKCHLSAHISTVRGVTDNRAHNLFFPTYSYRRAGNFLLKAKKYRLATELILNIHPARLFDTVINQTASTVAYIKTHSCSVSKCPKVRTAAASCPAGTYAAFYLCDIDPTIIVSRRDGLVSGTNTVTEEFTC